uniref:Uncharacterized protein n=1 Tax=Avena sativa TaxID=4498 RepID=A0ACD5WWW0_AVESA
MRLAAAILILLAVVACAGAASALGLEKPAVVAGAASAPGLKKTPAVNVVLPADTHGPMLGRFAALVYSLSRNVRLTCTGVSGVEQQPEKGGVTYRLVLTATDARGATNTYRVVVWGIPKTAQWMLLQFKLIN